MDLTRLQARLLKYNHDHGVPRDSELGRLGEVDLFGFLISGHRAAVGEASLVQRGFDTVWGAYKGLHYRTFRPALSRILLGFQAGAARLPSSERAKHTGRDPSALPT